MHLIVENQWCYRILRNLQLSIILVLKNDVSIFDIKSLFLQAHSLRTFKMWHPLLCGSYSLILRPMDVLSVAIHEDVFRLVLNLLFVDFIILLLLLILLSYLLQIPMTLCNITLSSVWTLIYYNILIRNVFSLISKTGLAIRTQIPIKYSSEIINLLLKIRILNHAN